VKKKGSKSLPQVFKWYASTCFHRYIF
jgi:hypothetical protein